MHRSFWLGLLLSSILLTTSAFAQATPADAEQRCRDLLAGFSKAHALSFTAEKVSAKGDKGCLYVGLRSEQKPTLVSIDTVDIDRIEPDPAGTDRPPLALRLSAMGLRLSDLSGDAARDYMLRNSAEPLAFSIDYELDAAAGTAKLSALTCNTRHGALSLSADIARFEPAMASGPSKDIVLRAALKSLDFSLRDDEGEIQRLLLVPVGYALLRGSPDPAARLKELKDQAAAWLRLSLTLVNMPKETIDATIAALMDFPKATKPLYLSIKLPQPVGVDDLFHAMIGGAGPGTLFPDGWIDLSYGK